MTMTDESSRKTLCCNCRGFRRWKRVICSRCDFLSSPTWQRGTLVTLLSSRL